VGGQVSEALAGDAGQPGYRRLAIRLAEEIAAGMYSAETPLPTDTELMVKYGLGRQTVRRAFQELVADGVVYRVRGRGTFPTQLPASGRTVRSTGSLEQLEQWSGTQMEVISPLELRRDPDYAARLELNGQAVARLTVRRWVDNEPFAVTDIVLPPDVGTQLVAEDRLPSAREPGTVIAAVGEMVGPVAQAEEIITAIMIPEDLAEKLRTAAGRPALRIERTYRNADGRPIEISSTVHAAERYEHRQSIHRAGQHGP
jgi:GntR family transcriptional regulator